MTKERDLDRFQQTLLKHRRPFEGEEKEWVDFRNPFNDSRIRFVPTEHLPKLDSREMDHNDNFGESKNKDRNEIYQGPVFELKGYPGFRYCPAALSEDLQLALCLEAMKTYCEFPHSTNIELVPCKGKSEYHSEKTIWELYKCELKQKKLLAQSGHTAKKRRKVNEPCPYKSLKKLSWSVLGYHYNWTDRCYDEDHKSMMPVELQRLSEYFALLYSNVKTFRSSASIINYYNGKSRMGGHRDDLELTFDKPVISMSFGLPAVFILGGTCKNDHATAIIVRAGDVMMLHNETRLSYHGISRIVANETSSTEMSMYECVSTQISRDDIFICNIDEDKSLEYDDIKQLLNDYRFNINLRQVLPDGHDQFSTHLHR